MRASSEPMSRRRSSGVAVPIFIGVALGLSGLYWLLFALRARGWLPFDPSSELLGTARGYTPALAALATALALSGREGLARLWKRVTMWRVAPWLYALALLGPLCASLVALLGARLLGTVAPFAPGAIPLPKLVIVFVFFALVDGPLGEEIGWRGYLLPKLLERRGPLVASLIIGVVWYLWHLPLYAATGRFEMTATFLIGYLIQNIAWSFVHTWFFRRSGGSAFLAVFLHTAGNYSVYLLVTLFPALEQTPATEAIYIGVLAVAAVGAAVAMRHETPGVVGVPGAGVGAS
ncbi:MAG: CPBP family intramembrane metalloprotease [Thermoanaerobaculia bacterium]|nr:CPBP family intramembrane metalloprotease [Thermoanaerobaculia bacterium]